jgi:integrase/recombinase XerC
VQESAPIDVLPRNRVRADAFLAHLRSERRLSAHTLLAYGRDIERLLELAGAADLGEIDVAIGRRLLARLHAAGGLRGRSLARMLCAWRSLYRYLMRDHGFVRNPFNGMRAPKSTRTLPKALSPDEAAKLLEFSAEDPLDVRDRAMFELFYSSGLRLSELTSLRPEDVSFDEETVRVTGKGDKTRIVPVGRAALEALRRWLPVRAALHSEHTGHALFPGRGERALSPRTVQERLRTRGLRQSLTGPVHPHMLRHSFASHVLQSSGDLRAVQEMLGHASISSTQVYTHLDFQHLAKVYDAAHPRAKKKA